VAGLTNETTYYFGVITINISDGFQAESHIVFRHSPSHDLEGPVFGAVLAENTPLTEGEKFACSRNQGQTTFSIYSQLFFSGALVYRV